MEHSEPTQVLFGLFVIFIAAQIGAEIAQRLKLPAVVGEIAAGCVIGPSVFNLVHLTDPLVMLSEIGAVLLLFSVGLETRIGDLKKVGSIALLVGVMGVIFPFLMAAVWAHGIAHFDTHKSLFVGAAFVATSAGITARVLQDLGALARIESRVILGAAVIDDILGMLLLGVVTALNESGSVHIGNIMIVLLEALAFVGLIALLGTRVMRRASPVLDAPISPHSPLTLSLAGCLALAALASYFKLAAIIGAFLAGMVAAESHQRKTLEHQIQPIMAFLVPFFFVVTGMQVNLQLLGTPSVLGTLALVTVLAAIGKLLGCGVAALQLGRKSALVVGVGMIPRGEVGIIVATLGLSAGIFQGETYAIIIAMSLLTSVIAPPLLKPLLANAAPEPDPLPDADEFNEDYLLSRVEETGHTDPNPDLPPV